MKLPFQMHDKYEFDEIADPLQLKKIKIFRKKASQSVFDTP